MEGVLAHKARSTPAVRAFAKQNGLDINQVKGTGNEGRVTRDDIRRFLAGDAAEEQSVSASQVPVSQPSLTGVTNQDEVKKIVGIKKAMTKTMT